MPENQSHRRAFGPGSVTRKAIPRRRFLQGAGVAMSLPFLTAMTPAFARADSPGSSPDAKRAPRRMLAICNNLGVLPEHFFPTDEGFDYQPSHYLTYLQEHRADFTVISGVSHPNVDGGHPSDISFLTAAPHPASSSFRNSISLDQHVAEHVGAQTRFPSLALAVNGNRSLSWTGTGVAIPPEQSASSVFGQLFLQGTKAEIEAKIREIDTGRSILDIVSQQAQALQGKIGAGDRDRLDQYFTSVRDLESRLQAARAWENKPKPVVDEPAPSDPTSSAQFIQKIEVMYRLARLAFQTDSVRAITLMQNGVSTPAMQIQGATIRDGYHNLSHHGKAADKLAQLKVIDEWQMRTLGGLLTELKSVEEQGETLLDRTMVLYGSNLGDANAHSTANMPILLAGGGFRHGQHLKFDAANNYPLPNLFVSMLQRMNIEASTFATATGTMRGLEMTS
jgi:BMFP domain-containing protein YqiC